MVSPVPPLPNDRLQQPRDLDIIACRRPSPAASNGAEVFGVRWASRPDLDWPKDGYIIERLVGGSTVSVAKNGSTFHLPRTDEWKNFKRDVEDCRPVAGPYFCSSDITELNLGHLLPIVRLVDPRIDPAEHKTLTEKVAAAFGFPHAEDAELTTVLWPGGEPPPLPDMLDKPRTAERIITYYRRQARGFLLALAVRFEYAALLGLGTDDVALRPLAEVSQVR